MSKNKKIRMEIRFDSVEDKDMINFIDKYGSTRAGFIKQVLKIYKNQVESMPSNKNDNVTNEQESKKDEYKDIPKINDVAFSSKDL